MIEQCVQHRKLQGGHEEGISCLVCAKSKIKNPKSKIQIIKSKIQNLRYQMLTEQCVQHRKLQAGHEEGISCHVRDTSEKCTFSSSALPTGAYICSRQYAQCSDTAFLYIFIVLILCLHRSLIPIASLYEAIQECYPRGLSAGGSNLSAEHRHRI